MKIRIVGIDISLRNLGASLCEYDCETNKLTVLGTNTMSPSDISGKQVRQNSKDIRYALQHATALRKVAAKADLICVEVPTGSQTARASASYGICIGVIGSLKEYSDIPMIEVTPDAVKKIATGRSSATKQEIIDWVLKMNPETNFSKHLGKISVTKAEHQADSIAAIYAAMDSETFKTMVILKRKQYETNPSSK